MIDEKKILALICARGGSKGVPMKNIRPLGGKPLIEWSIETAMKNELIDKLIVSTDDTIIAAVAERSGATVPFLRPKELAGDRSPELPVWKHALSQLDTNGGFKADYLVVLPPTAPFRSPEDINDGLDILHADNTDIVISVTESRKNPYFNMVEIDAEGYASLSKPVSSKIFRRQDAPKVYEMTTVLYAARVDFILGTSSLFDGRVKTLVVPETRALDIDTPLDFKFAEFLLENGSCDFPVLLENTISAPA